METRSDTITKLVDDFILTTTTSWETYAQNVVEHYHITVSAGKRTFKFHTDGDAYKDARANQQIIKRLLHGDVRMPVEIEESLIEGLPGDWQRGLKAALASRMGLMASPFPSTDTAKEIEHVGEVAKEFGDLFQALGEAYADNKLDEKDAHLVDKILKEGDELIAIVNTIMHKAEAIKSKNNVYVLRQN